MGSKKKKSKNSPTPVASAQEPLPDVDNDDLLDELMAQLDAKDVVAQQEAAAVIQEVEINDADEIEAKSSKKGGRARFEARKVGVLPSLMKLRKSRLTPVFPFQLKKVAEQAARYTNDDKDADARLEREAREEERAIKQVCDELGLVMHEVRLCYSPYNSLTCI